MIIDMGSGVDTVLGVRPGSVSGPGEKRGDKIMKDRRFLIGLAGLMLLAAGCGRQKIPEATYLDSAVLPPETRSLYLQKAHIAPGISIPMIDPQFLYTSLTQKQGRKWVTASQISMVFTLDASALAEFKSKLKSIPAPEYVPAQGPVAWWMNADEFPSLEFYESAPVMNSKQGFVAIRPSDNTVFMLGMN